MIKRRIVLMLFSLVAISGASYGEEEKQAKPVVKLTPKMREVSRDAAWFSRIPCDELYKIETSNEAEARYLEERRRQCLRAISVFE